LSAVPPAEPCQRALDATQEQVLMVRVGDVLDRAFDVRRRHLS
jgi:hypothetical protein